MSLSDRGIWFIVTLGILSLKVCLSPDLIISFINYGSFFKKKLLKHLNNPNKQCIVCFSIKILNFKK